MFSFGSGDWMNAALLSSSHARVLLVIEPATTVFALQIPVAGSNLLLKTKKRLETYTSSLFFWLRGLDSNQRPSGYTFSTTFVAVWTISLP